MKRTHAVVFGFFSILLMFSCGKRKGPAEVEFLKVAEDVKANQKIMKPYQLQVAADYNLGDNRNNKTVTDEQYALVVNQLVANERDAILYCRDKGELKNALKNYADVKKSAMSYYLISVLDCSIHNFDISVINKAIAIDGQIGEFYIQRAFIYDALGKSQLAVNDYNTAIRLHSDSLIVYSCLLHHYQSTKNETELFNTHRLIISHLTNVIKPYIHVEDVLGMQVAKRNLSLEYVAQAYDFMAYNKPDSVKLAIKKAIELGYQVTPQESRDFAELTKAL